MVKRPKTIDHFPGNFILFKIGLVQFCHIYDSLYINAPKSRKNVKSFFLATEIFDHFQSKDPKFLDLVLKHLKIRLKSVLITFYDVYQSPVSIPLCSVPGRANFS